MIGRSAFFLAAAVGSATLAASVAGGILAARRRFIVIDVTGDSMSPSLVDGDRLLVRRTHRLRVSDIVIAHQQEGGRRTASEREASAWLVKRLVALPGDAVPESVSSAVEGCPRQVPAGMTVLLGEHPESVDSRRWGFVPLDDIEGVVIGRLRTSAR